MQARVTSLNGDGRRRDEDPSTAVAVLVVGTDEWAIEQAAASLAVVGHRVLRCHEPGEPAFPCNALVAGRRCPLDAGASVVVTSRARPVDAPAPSEMGVICALHARIPLVVTGISRDAPFTPWASGVVTGRGDLAEAVAEAAGGEDVPAPRVVQLPADGRP